MMTFPKTIKNHCSGHYYVDPRIICFKTEGLIPPATGRAAGRQPSTVSLLWELPRRTAEESDQTQRLHTLPMCGLHLISSQCWGIKVQPPCSNWGQFMEVIIELQFPVWSTPVL